MPAAPLRVRDAYAAFRHRNFRLYVTGNLISTAGLQMQTVAVGWYIYERTHSALALGMVGLVQFIPVAALMLVAGHAVDRYDRKRILLLAQSCMMLASIGLVLLAVLDAPVQLTYACLFLSGAGQSFQGPARSALFSRLTTANSLENAVTWNSGAWQLASVLGPAAGGALIAATHGAVAVYVCTALASLTFIVLIIAIDANSAPSAVAAAATAETLLAGLAYVFRTKVLLASITLDLFAVLFGGAIMLLPMFAKDILHVGPSGLGWLLAAPALGAVTMAVIMAHRRPIERAGRALIWAVIGFGGATVVFGLSRSFPLSLFVLILTGMFDHVSVVVRSTLVQLGTPDAMRGRVAAVNSLFVGTSNELGGFESGAAAAAFGPVTAVVGGGIITVIVVIVAAIVWPEIRRLGSLRSIAEASP